MSAPIIKCPRFVVSINGQQRCVAGVDGYGVLNAGITFTRFPIVERLTSALISGVAPIHVGGLQGRQHVHWMNEDLFVGDEVTIRVLDGGLFDTPVSGVGGAHPTRADVERLLEARRHRLAQISDVIPHRFQVLGNGEQFCVAGVESGVLTIHVSWVRRDPANYSDQFPEPREEWERGDADVRVGALEDGAHLDWFCAYVEEGDETTIRILGPGPIDPPLSRRDAQDESGHQD